MAPPRYGPHTGVIVVPHPDSGPTLDQINDFIEKSIELCISIDVEPVLKFHPRDNAYSRKIKEKYPHSIIADQKYPLELTLYVEKNIQVITGYRTSALHVISALHPDKRILYYEHEDDSASEEWVKFYKELSIPALR